MLFTKSINEAFNLLSNLFLTEITENTICVGLARVGAADQKIVSGTLYQMSTVELGGPLHSLIVTGTLHPLELEMLKLFSVDSSSFEKNELQQK